MTRKLLLLLALLPTPAFAGAKPPDVQAYVPITPTYASGVTLNVVNTGTPPAYANMPANISYSTTGWIVATSPAYCDIGVVSDGSHGCANGYTGLETKLRIAGNATHILHDDPIRNYGVPGASHLHEFYGNSSANAYSTYNSLRKRPDSSMNGGTVNSSGYWFPCPIKTNPFSDGKNYCIRSNTVPVYYEGAHLLTASTGNEVYIPRGLRFVFGTNMDDPDDLGVKAEIAAANAQPGTAGRYQYAGNGFAGWSCNGTYQPYLKNTDGTDPWGGTCPAGLIAAEAAGPACWDGTNLWSPSGYAHVRQEIRDTVTNSLVCPNNWYRIFKVRVKPQFTSTGAADYMTWRLSSDDMAATAAGHAMRNGESFHTDYIMAWDDTVLRTTEDFCVAANGATGHECNNGTLTSTTRAIGNENAPDGSRSPQTDGTQTYGTASASVMYQVPASSQGPVTLHTH